MNRSAALPTDGSRSGDPFDGCLGLCISIHSVRTSRAPLIGPLATYSTHVSSLRKILESFLAVADPLSVGEFVAGLKGRRLPSRFVVVTFDDGYRDTLDVAKPLLAEFGVPFTVFLTTGFLDRTSLPVELELGRHFEMRLPSTSWGPIDRMFTALSGRLRKLSAEYETQRRRLKGASDEERARIVRSLRDHLSGDTFDLLLSWDEVRLLEKSPLVTIGAHGHAHLDLTTAATADAASEVSLSRRRITEELGVVPEFFCFAYGAAKEEHLTMVERAGFRAAFGIGTEVVHPGSLDPYRIPRVDISDTVSLNRALACLESP